MGQWALTVYPVHARTQGRPSCDLFVYIHPRNVYGVGGFVYIGGLCPARN